MPRDPADWPSTPNDTVPIGPVYPFLDAVVLDEDGQRSTEGELCVRGLQRFGGYLDPADNAGRFLALDSSAPVHVLDESDELTGRHYYRTGDRVRLEGNRLTHLGRLDTQIKIRGYRRVLHRGPAAGLAARPGTAPHGPQPLHRAGRTAAQPERQDRPPGPAPLPHRGPAGDRLTPAPHRTGDNGPAGPGRTARPAPEPGGAGQ